MKRIAALSLAVALAASSVHAQNAPVGSADPATSLELGAGGGLAAGSALAALAAIVIIIAVSGDDDDGPTTTTTTN